MSSMSNRYTVGEAINSYGFGKFQLWIASIVGFAGVADAMEMMILSILAPALHCHWHISEYQQALLTTVVFTGMMIAAPFWGIIADRLGRRFVIVWGSGFLFYFGFLSAFSPGFRWIAFLRFLVGVFMAGVPQATTLFLEYLPVSARGKSIVFQSLFWALGSVFEAVLAWMVMPSLGWRYLIAFSAIPLLIFVIMAPMLPESPMYLAITGQREEVQSQLSKVARFNKKPIVTGELVLDPRPEEEVDEAPIHNRGRFLDLFREGRCRLSLSLIFLWNVCACSYYGVVLLSTEMLNSDKDVCASVRDDRTTTISHEASKATEEIECSLHTCRGLSDSDYVKLIWTTLAEFPATLVPLFLIDWIGRKKTLAFQAFMYAISTLVILECGRNKTILVIALFASRGFTAGMFQTVYLYTPEVYPTNMRAMALGFGSASARIGAMVTPFIAQVLLKQSFYIAIVLYAGIGFAAGIVSLSLPIETSGKDLTMAKINSSINSTGKELVGNMEENEAEQAQDGENRTRY